MGGFRCHRLVGSDVIKKVGSNACILEHKSIKLNQAGRSETVPFRFCSRALFSFFFRSHRPPPSSVGTRLPLGSQTLSSTPDAEAPGPVNYLDRPPQSFLAEGPPTSRASCPRSHARLCPPLGLVGGWSRQWLSSPIFTAIPGGSKEKGESDNEASGSAPRHDNLCLSPRRSAIHAQKMPGADTRASITRPRLAASYLALRVLVAVEELLVVLLVRPAGEKEGERGADGGDQGQDAGVINAQGLRKTWEKRDCLMTRLLRRNLLVCPRYTPTIIAACTILPFHFPLKYLPRPFPPWRRRGKTE